MVNNIKQPIYGDFLSQKALVFPHYSLYILFMISCMFLLLETTNTSQKYFIITPFIECLLSHFKQQFFYQQPWPYHGHTWFFSSSLAAPKEYKLAPSCSPWDLGAPSACPQLAPVECAAVGFSWSCFAAVTCW